MLTGHLAVGFIGKRVESKLSVGTLVLAALLSDLLWCVFLITGVERVQFKPGIVVSPAIRALDALEASEVGYSHSLMMTAIWGVLLALLYYAVRRNPTGAWVLFGAVLSHWVLDVISHPPDMPLLPGGMQRKFGFGLWNSIPATLAIEGALWAAAIFLYLRTARPRARSFFYVFWSAIVLLTIAWIGNIAGPPPANVSTIGFSSLAFFSLTVAWAYWINRLGLI
jgi:LexA-binding, inner membrane-associated putative hydrolase